MKIHYIMHAPFEKLSAIEVWATQKSYDLSGTHVYKGEKLPRALNFDCLILMGGPQSPFKTDKYPYLLDEIQFVKKDLAGNKKILGICLGAQLIAEALGAKTLHSPYKEIGIYPIQTLPEATDDPFFSKLPKSFDVMHWHNDMPGIPKDVVLLAKGEGCPHQAFRYGDRVYGFQFHMELTLSVIEEMIEKYRGDLEPGKFVRTKEEMLHSNYNEVNAKMFTFLDYLEGV
ncbi:MAG: GMP synthase [Coxiella burnetii]|nr:GMP synthase [Coxiella burnetii]